MAKYYRANNKKGYLNARIIPSDTQLELQNIDYGGGAKDRNIPTIADKLMRLVIWGIQYPNPSADPDREIISATWSGTTQIFDIIRAQEGTDAGEHYTGDNVALLFTAGMSREILIFEDFEESIPGSIAYTDDTDEDGEMEVLALPPDNEISTVILPSSIELYDSYVDGIDYQKTVYWIGTRYVWFAQTFTPEENYNITSVILKLYRTGLPGQVPVSIRATDAVTGKPTGPDLCTDTFDGNEITTNTDGEEITFSFDSSSLVAGTKYVIILKSPINERTYVNWKIDKADGGYSGGSTYISIDGGVTWTTDFIRRIICGGTVDEGYLAWRIDDHGVVHQNLLLGYAVESYASAVCANGKFYTSKRNVVWKFKKDGTIDTSWGAGGDGSMTFGTVGVLDLTLDSEENLYVVCTTPGTSSSGNTIWKLDSTGNVIWSTYSLNWARGTSGIVIASDGYPYVACGKTTGSYKQGMKISPVNGAIIRTYTGQGARKVAVDDFGYVYLAGTQTGYNLIRWNNAGTTFHSKLVDACTLSDVFVISGASAEATKVYVTGRDSTNNISVWKLNYDLSVIEATYNGYYSYSITEDTDGSLLVTCHPTLAGEDGIYQIVKLTAADLSFIFGIKFNDARLNHVSRQVLSDPVGEDGDFYFKTYGFTSVVEEEYRKILVSGGIGEIPYWQFIWAEEVGGTKQV